MHGIESVLEFETCSYQDAGEYMCTAWNEYGGSIVDANKNISLIVHAFTAAFDLLVVVFCGITIGIFILTLSSGSIIMWKGIQRTRLNPPPKDCSELPAESCSGVYVIQPENGPSMTVFCEMGIDNGGWTTVQRRYDGTVDFYRLWDDYKTGFGNIAGEHWLGNDNLHFILRQRSYQVQFDLEDFTGNTSYAVYSTMYVGDESANYKLKLTEYHGAAGDGMVSVGGILSSDGMMFSTRDRDNDINEDKHCAINKKSGWWHCSCSYANINGGVYSEQYSKSSVHWRAWKLTGLKKTIMMIKPNKNDY